MVKSILFVLTRMSVFSLKNPVMKNPAMKNPSMRTTWKKERTRPPSPTGMDNREKP